MTIRKLVKKLNSRAGESLAETLVALLISALALVMLAGAITAAGDVVTRSKNKLKDYYTENENIVQRNTSGGGGNITITGDGVSIPSYAITIYKNEEFSKYPVVSYKH